MATPQTSEVRQVCQFCAQMLCMEGKRKRIIVPHHGTVAEFSQHASECILCRFIMESWNLEYAHSRFPELSERDYESMPLEIRLKTPELLNTNVSWSVYDVVIKVPKHGMHFASDISITSCRDEDTKSAIWSTQTLSTSDKLTTLKTWFEECESSHAACAPTVSVLPKHLVTTGLYDGGIRLIQTGNLNQERARYATLSHCWGKKLPLRTTSRNKEMLEKGMSEDILPRTFQDAIELARGLGIPYIWIDALCIRQDDPVEWAHEAGKMKDIYAGSVLTIAASNSTCSDDGCFTAAPPDHRLFAITQFSIETVDGHTLHFRVQDGDIRLLSSETSLSSRGWVLQEEILSRRVVFCILPEMHWRCQCCYQIESGAAFNARESRVLPLLNGIPRADLHNIWYHWMANYSDRKFTFEKDKLSAMAGIIEHFASVSGDRHILGCWESSFAQGLMWLPLSRDPPRSGFPGIPSWSWLTRHDDVKYDHWTREFKRVAHEYHVKLLDSNVSWSGVPLFSDITAAQARISGPIQDFVLSIAPEARDFNPPYLNVGDEVPDFKDKPIPWRCSGRIDHGGDMKQSYTCLLLWSYAASARKNYDQEIFLLLKPVISTGSTATTYQRVGIAKFRGKKSQFTNRRYQDIILI